jgi:hypothetical protein
MPSKWYYVLAILVLLAGQGAATYVLYKDFSNFSKSRILVTVPGENLLELPSAGNYTIFYEYRSAIGNRLYSGSPDEIPELTCKLSTEEGRSVDLIPKVGGARYSSMGGPAGVSLFQFKVHDKGRYALNCYYEDGRAEPDVVLAVSGGFTVGTLRTMGITALILLVAMATGAYIAYKTFVGRRKIQKAMR